MGGLMPPATLSSRLIKRNLAPFSELSAVDPCSSGVLGLAREGPVACVAKDTAACSTAGVVPTPAHQSLTLASRQPPLLQQLQPQQLPKPQLLKPQLPKPQLLQPQLLKPQLLKPQLLRPQLLQKLQLPQKPQLRQKPQRLQKPQLPLKRQLLQKQQLLLLSKILYGYISELNDPA